MGLRARVSLSFLAVVLPLLVVGEWYLCSSGRFPPAILIAYWSCVLIAASALTAELFLLRPVRRLSRYMQTAARRHGSPSIARGGDEIATLARSLVAMMRSLRSEQKLVSSSLESVQKAYGRLRVAQYLAQKALSLESRDEFWALTAEHLCLFFACDRVTVFERGKKDELHSVFAKDLATPVAVKLGEGIAGHAATTQTKYLTNDPYHDAHFNVEMDRSTNYKTQSLLAFPLIYQDRTVGVIELINKPGGFGSNDVDAVNYLGPQIAVSLVKFKSEEKQKELTHQMMQVEKMAAVGRLAAGVAHEVNNPLSAIRGFTQLLLRTVGPQAEKDLLKIDAESRRIQAIVQNLLGFSRASPSAFSTVALPSIVDATLSLLEHELRHRRVEAVRKYDAALPPMLGDTNKLKQVFINLTLNALQAMEGREGGKIVYRVRQDAQKDSIVASVSDNGPGIAPENLDKIFEPFFTTKEVGKGTGLGLYVVMGIIEQHKAKIRVESKVGQGTSFELRFLLNPEG